MRSYTVTIRNINADVKKMLIAKGDTSTITCASDNEAGVITKAVKRMFDGCGFMMDVAAGGSGYYGQITYPGAGGTTSLYGRIWVFVE